MRAVLVRRLRSWSRCARGLSAVEFALLAPILFFALIATVDIGLAVYERMTIDHVLRAGAQSAMEDRGEAKVRELIETTAARNFAAGELALSADRYCACPENPGFGDAVDCSTPCADSQPTFIFYRLSGERDYTGRILPTIRLATAIQVQVR